MLNYPSPERFFEQCLVETGLRDWQSAAIALQQVQNTPALHKSLVRALRDLQQGADTVLARGKPAEDTLGLARRDWESRWAAWTASRKAAFYSRAALLMLGEREYFAYFIKTLRSSHNIDFLCSASDALQHATGHYLSGPEEDLTPSEQARRWEQFLTANVI